MSSIGKVRRRTWIHKGLKREAWSFTLVADGTRIRRSGFLSRAEAQEALETVKRPVSVVAAAAPVAAMTLGEAFTRYFQVKARKKSVVEDRRISRVLLEQFGDVPLTSLTAASISSYKGELLAITTSRRGGPLSSASINRPLQLLRHLLRLAHEEWELLAVVPKIRLEKEPQGRIRWLEPDEEVRLLAACAA